MTHLLDAIAKIGATAADRAAHSAKKTYLRRLSDGEREVQVSVSRTGHVS